MTSPDRRRSQIRAHSPLARTMRTPLARWGFTVLALFAATNQLAWPALACTAFAVYAWKHR